MTDVDTFEGQRGLSLDDSLDGERETRREAGGSGGGERDRQRGGQGRETENRTGSRPLGKRQGASPALVWMGVGRLEGRRTPPSPAQRRTGLLRSSAHTGFSPVPAPHAKSVLWPLLPPRGVLW